MHRVTAHRRAWIFLSGNEEISVLVVAAALAPKGLRPMNRGDVPHPQRVRDVQVLRARLQQQTMILRFIAAREVSMHIARAPAAGGHIGPALQLHCQVRLGIGRDVESPCNVSVLDTLSGNQRVLARRQLRAISAVNVERPPILRRPIYGRPAKARCAPGSRSPSPLRQTIRAAAFVPTRRRWTFARALARRARRACPRSASRMRAAPASSERARDDHVADGR